MGKIRDTFKKMRDTKGTFHAKVGTIKDENGMDLRSRRYEEVARIHRNHLHFYVLTTMKNQKEKLGILSHSPLQQK